MNKLKEGILVFTPDLRPSLMSILKGLAEAHLLGLCITTLAIDGRTLTGKFMKMIRDILPRRYAKGIERRFLPDFLEGKNRFFSYGEILRLLANGLGNRIFAHRVWLWSEFEFDRKVAARYAGIYSCVYGMEHGSLFTFRRQKESGGFCLLRQVMAHGSAVIETFKRQIEEFPEYADSRSRFFLEDMSRALKRKEEEYRLADLIVANSEFVRDTFVRSGVEADKIAVIPTGCPAIQAASANSGRGSGKLIFLFAGRLSLRKGLPYLLEAWRMLGAQNSAQLWLAGEIEISQSLLKKSGEGIRYFGAVGPQELSDLYRKADVFVLPTLLEGLAYVVLEALSSGLPVITTRESGCGRLVEDGLNGVMVQAADAAALYKAFDWCLNNRKRLMDMGKASLDMALSWTQEDSNRRHLEVVRDFLDKR